MRTSRIVVGYDGSPQSWSAARWAVAEAYRHDCALHVVNAYELPQLAAFYEDSRVPPPTGVAERAERHLSDLVAHLHATYASVDIVGTAVPGSPAQTLLDLSVGSRMLVVGSRGAGGFAGLLLGSVSQQVATHAHVPVAVLRGRAGRPDGPVLVGVDGSAAADVALDLAFEEAAARGARVLAVRAYGPAPAHSGTTPVTIPRDVVLAEERAALDASMSPWRGKYPSVTVDTELVAGKPSRVLVERSRTAQVAVVGSRGHGGFVGLLLGSVGQQLMHHAGCPVIISHEPT